MNNTKLAIPGPNKQLNLPGIQEAIVTKEKIQRLTMEIISKCPMTCQTCIEGPKENLVKQIKMKEFEEKVLALTKYKTVRLAGYEALNHEYIHEMIDFLINNEKEVEIATKGIINGKSINVFLLDKLAGKVRIVFYYNHSAGEDFWGDFLDSVEMCAIRNIPFTFESIIKEDNFDKIENIVRDVSMLHKLHAKNIDAKKLPKTKIHFIRRLKSDGKEDSKFNFPTEYFDALSQKYGVKITHGARREVDSCSCGNNGIMITA